MAGDVLDRKARGWMKALRPYRRASREERFPFTPGDAALLVIDMQKYFLEDESHACVPMGGAVLENISRLTSSFRDAARPVIYTRHALLDDEDAGIMDRWWADTIRVSDSISEIASEIAPAEGEEVIRKTRYNAFIGTPLESVLKSANVKSIVVTGVMTHLCCESTAREAFMRDFTVYFVVDGTASSDEDLHLSSLKTLTDGFAVPVTTEEVLGWMRG